MATIKNRLEQLENRLSPPPLRPMVIGLYAATLDDIHRIQTRYENKPSAMVHMVAVYHGEPNAEAEALVSPENYLPKISTQEATA